MKTLSCPRCTARPLAPRTLYGVEIDACGNCYGAWFDRGELDAWIAGSGVTASSVKRATPAVSAQPPHACPKCAEPMRAQVRSGTIPLTLQLCPAGDGLWIGGAEMSKLQAAKPEAYRKPPAAVTTNVIVERRAPRPWYDTRESNWGDTVDLFSDLIQDLNRL